MSSGALAPRRRRCCSRWPGCALALGIAAVAVALAECYRAPPMLFALLIGLALSFLGAQPAFAPGVEFAAGAVLRLGVALLGLRVSLDQIVQLGWPAVALVTISVIVTMALSVLAARWAGFNPLFGLLSGGATAICGASAALALAAALPAHPEKEKATAFTVICVSVLSTLAMVLYPMLAGALGMSARVAGMFIGGSIHDVAQVVGAGYGMSRETGDIATVIKLMRIAMLLPVILCAGLLARARHDVQAGRRPPLLPWFALGFLALAVLNGNDYIDARLLRAGNELSRWCLVAAMSAIGLKARLKEVLAVGSGPVALMAGEAVLLAALVLGLAHWLG